MKETAMAVPTILTRLDRPRQLMIAALLAATVGIIVQIAAGVHYGTAGR
jgi:hypothetical protein